MPTAAKHLDTALDTAGQGPGHTMVGTKPTVFPSSLCCLEKARISSLLVKTGMVNCCCCTAAAMVGKLLSIKHDCEQNNPT
jgi:hypothetical protein